MTDLLRLYYHFNTRIPPVKYDRTSIFNIFVFSAGAFLPPTTALGAGLYSISIYGGLVLFGMFLLYDTQKIMKRAETTPLYGAQPYDPVNAYVLDLFFTLVCTAYLFQVIIILLMPMISHNFTNFIFIALTLSMC